MTAVRISLKIYQRSDGQVPFRKWMRKLHDTRAKQIIEARLRRVNLGALGDHKAVGDGVYELRIHFGPGYRVYFGYHGKVVIVLLSGGQKGTQDEDIKKAKAYWKDYQKENKDADH